jgi:methyltransferase (TIGR00027 family)
MMSITALLNAVMRAYHAEHDRPPIFDDSLAAALFTPEERTHYEDALAKSLERFDPAAAAAATSRDDALARSMREQSGPLIFARARFGEDLLDRALAAGTTQYVILGAGFDTFAYRRRDVSDGDRVRVFEVDHPRTQAEKQRRVERAGWSAPRGLTHVPIDFATDDLEAALRAAGLDPSQRTFFSWMGVTYYLERDAMTATFRALARLGAPGSTLVFDHLDDAAFDDARATPRMRLTRELVARVGEPMKTGLAPDDMAATLRACGWATVEQLGPAELQARYFDPHPREYRARDHFHVVSASSNSASASISTSTSTST